MTNIDLATPEQLLDGVEIHGVTRGSFIMKGALAASAAYGATAAAPFVSQALRGSARRHPQHAARQVGDA